MQLLRLKDVRQSRIPETIGVCPADQVKLIETVNEAQQRLIFAGGETGWWGSWFKTVFNVDSASDPFITLPRTIARIINLDVCKRPVRIQNEFYEFLEAGIGLQPSGVCGTSARSGCNLLEIYDRGMFPTFSDLKPPNKKLRFYITDAADVGRRVLVQGTDQNGTTIYSLDGIDEVTGVYVALTQPFVDSPVINSITGIQKDFTVGQVKVFEVDTVTGDQRLILTMEPSEEVAGYRRYFLNGLPCNCCDPSDPSVTTVQVTAMAKLAIIPVAVDTDYLVIQNLAALKEECQAVRFGEMDEPLGEVQADKRHAKAIKLLNGELQHHLGKEMPAINFAPFGTAKLSHQRIGALT